MAKNTKNPLIGEQDMAQIYLDIAGVMLVVINTDQEVTVINKKGCKILGFTENEILGSNWFDKFIPEQIRVDIKAAFIQLMSGKGEMVRQHEHPVRIKSGEDRIIEWQSTILRDHNGTITGTLSSGNDITAHRHAEEEIAISQQALITKHKNLNELFRKIEIINKEQQKIMDAVEDMIILTDFEGKIKRANRAARDFSKKSYDVLIGKDWEEFIYENDLEAMSLLAGSTKLFHKPTHKWFVLNAYPFEDTALNFSGTVITLHETTEMSEKLGKSNITINQNRGR